MPSLHVLLVLPSLLLRQHLVLQLLLQVCFLTNWICIDYPQRKLTLNLGSTEITINDEIITITNPTTLTVTDECTIDYITTVDDQSSLIINQQSSSVPILQSGNTHNTSTNVTVIEANGANRLLTNAVIAAAAGVAIVVMM